jgi:hypothetical protein
MPDDGVRVLGKVSLERLTEFYRRAWLFCLPSSYEGSASRTSRQWHRGQRSSRHESRALEVLAAVATERSYVTKNSAPLCRLIDDAALRQRYAEVRLRRARDFDWNAICSAYENVYGRALADRSTFISRLSPQTVVPKMSQPGRTQIRTLANSVPAQARRLNATFHQPGGTVVRRHPVVSAALSAHMADARKRYVRRQPSNGLAWR